MTSVATVRMGQSEDRGLILEMRRRFYADQSDKGLLDVPLDLEEFLVKTTDAALNQRRSGLFLAWRDDAPAGYVLVNHKFTPTTRKPNLWSIEELFIEPGHRGARVGEALTNEAVRYFKGNKADRIQLRVLQANDEGHRFWQKHGFRPTLTLYEL